MKSDRPKRIVLPGGTGFLGTGLRNRLVGRGDHVTILTRGASASGDGWDHVHWDGRSDVDWFESIDGADAIVHLSGKRVDCRATKANLEELISSRVQPVQAVGRAVEAADMKPKTWVQISSLAIFGEGGEEIIDEFSQPSGVGPPQMVQVCLAWEFAATAAVATLDRFVMLRGGIALGGEGDPATKRLIALSRWWLGGKIGSGRQWVSWISVEDFLDVILRAIDDETMSGNYHVTSPNPVTNAQMMQTYRELAGRRWGLSSPGPITKLGDWMIGSDAILGLAGRRAVPTRLEAEGFEFRHPHFDEAAANAVATLI